MAPAAPPMLSPIHHIRAPIRAAMGKVVAQAVTIRPAVDHRTGVPRPRPPPSTEPVATWVVESAKPEVARGEQHGRGGAVARTCPGVG